VTTGRFVSSPHVLARGGGVADLDAANGATVFAGETGLMFGIHPETAGTGVATRTLTLHNRGAAPQRFAVATTTGQPAATMNVTPNDVTVPAGGSATVTIELHLDYAALPFPKGLVIGGDVVFSGTAAFHVPWAAMRGARATIDIDPAHINPLTAYGPTGVETLWPYAPGRAEVWVVPGRWDFLLLGFQQSTVVTAENQLIDRTNVVVMRNASATLPVSLRARDTSGQLLAPPAPEGWPKKHYARLYIDYDHHGYHHSDWTPLLSPDVLFTPSERFTFVAAEMHVDPKRMYSVLHEPLRGISGPVTLSRDATDYLHARVTVPPSSKLCLDGVLTTDDNGFSTLSECTFPIVSGTVDYYATEDADFAGQGLFVAGPVSSPLLRAVDGEFVFAGWDRVPAPTAFRFRDSGSVTVGEGPLHPGVNPASGWEWDWDGGLFGPLGERFKNSERTRWFLVDKHDKLLERGIVSAYEFCCRAVNAGDRYVAQSDTFEGTVFLTFGRAFATKNWWHQQQPRISSLRIVDAVGRLTTTVEGGRTSWLEFSAVNYSPDGKRQVPMRPEATKVRAGRNASGDYRELPFVIVAADNGSRAELGHDPVGEIYRVDLSPLGDLRGGMELIIVVEDEYGTRLEWRDQFAFTIEDPEPGRRRSARH